jgi:hypothetical protein
MENKQNVYKCMCVRLGTIQFLYIFHFVLNFHHVGVPYSHELRRLLSCMYPKTSTVHWRRFLDLFWTTLTTLYGGWKRPGTIFFCLSCHCTHVTAVLNGARKTQKGQRQQMAKIITLHREKESFFCVAFVHITYHFRIWKWIQKETRGTWEFALNFRKEHGKCIECIREWDADQGVGTPTVESPKIGRKRVDVVRFFSSHFVSSNRRFWKDSRFQLILRKKWVTWP